MISFGGVSVVELLQDGFVESRSSCSSSDPHSVVELHGHPITVLGIACRARVSQSENFWRNFLRQAGKIVGNFIEQEHSPPNRQEQESPFIPIWACLAPGLVVGCLW